jgi:hypothetical protein
MFVAFNSEMLEARGAASVGRRLALASLIAGSPLTSYRGSPEDSDMELQQKRKSTGRLLIAALVAAALSMA